EGVAASRFGHEAARHVQKSPRDGKGGTRVRKGGCRAREQAAGLVDGGGVGTSATRDAPDRVEEEATRGAGRLGEGAPVADLEDLGSVWPQAWFPEDPLWNVQTVEHGGEVEREPQQHPGLAAGQGLSVQGEGAIEMFETLHEVALVVE